MRKFVGDDAFQFHFFKFLQNSAGNANHGMGGIAAGGGVAITKAHDVGRSARWRGLAVLRISADGSEYSTDAGGQWYNHGRKTFLFIGSDSLKDRRLRAFTLAKAWVAEHLGEPGPWVRNACGNYVPKRVEKAHPIRRTK